MQNVIVKPISRNEGNKWLPEGFIQFPQGNTLTERPEFYSVEFDSKEEADEYFIQASIKKYRI